MFRSRPGRDCWHFCENCPAWPWDCDDFETDDEPPRERWCKTCVRMYEADTGDLEWPQPGPTPSPVFVALCNSWSSGTLQLKGEEAADSQPYEGQQPAPDRVHRDQPPQGDRAEPPDISTQERAAIIAERRAIANAPAAVAVAKPRRVTAGMLDALSGLAEILVPRVGEPEETEVTNADPDRGID